MNERIIGVDGYMGKIFCLMGKSSVGKDTFFESLIKDEALGLKPVVLYTTRPKRSNEIEGKNYYFITEKNLEEFKQHNKIIEHRVYDTIEGPWHYATIDDGKINLDNENYLMIVTLEAYKHIVQYFGQNQVIPLYIEVEDGLRLERALERERQQAIPRYEELCRRFLADSRDFSAALLEESGIVRGYQNIEFSDCMVQLREEIRSKVD